MSKNKQPSKPNSARDSSVGKAVNKETYKADINKAMSIKPIQTIPKPKKD